MKLKAPTLTRRADLLARKFPKSTLHPEVLAWVGQNITHGPWVVSLSGGVDSVLLLVLLWVHWPERRDRLRALHFNHRLRGRASDGDETFCREICRLWGIPIWVGRCGLKTKINNEAHARDLRFEFIDRVMQKVGAHALWLGHQQNDVAETLLMRLARGSGSSGLGAPRPVQSMPFKRVHLRPLLNLKRSEIYAAMGEVRLPWREDATNQTGVYFRNRIRLEVIPAWVSAAERDAIAGAARSRELLSEDDAALGVWAHRLWSNMPEGQLDLKALKDVPRAVVRRLLHHWLMSIKNVGDISRQAFDCLLDAVICGESTRQSIGNVGFAVIRRRVLFFEMGRINTPKTLRR